MKNSEHRPKTLTELAAAGLLLALFLVLAYGPAKLEGHSIYAGVIQDVTNLYGFSSWDEFSGQELQAGRVPLWNPHNGFGVPHLANMQTAVFYPLNFIKWRCGFFTTIDFILMLRLWLAGIFTWLFLRHALKIGFFAAAIGAASFMLTGYFTRYVYMSHLNVEILIPLQLLLMHRLATRPGPGAVAMAGLGFALLVLGGFPEASLYAVSFAGLYYLFAAGPSRKSFILLAASLALGLIVSGAQWLPFTEYYAQAWTYHGAHSGIKGFDPRLSISLLLPWFFGDNRLSPAAAFVSPHLGVIPVLLALYLALGIRKQNRDPVFFVVVAIALLGVIYNTPPFSWLARIFPFSHTYNYKYAAPELALCVSVLAGRGAHGLALEKKWQRFSISGLIILAGLGACVVIGLPPGHGFRPYYALGLLTPGIVVAALFLVAIALALAFMHTKEIISGRALSIGLLALCLVGLLYDQVGDRPVYHDDLKARAEKAAKPLVVKTGAGRVYVDPELKELFANLLLPLGIDDLRSYDPLYPKTYVEYMAAVNDLQGQTLIDHYNSNMLFALEPGSIGHPLLALANVGAYMLPTRIDERMIMKDWIESALVVNSRNESWLRYDLFESGGETRPALMEHAPVRIQGAASIAAHDSGAEKSKLRFEAAIPDDQVTGGEDADGVQFIALRKDNPEKSSLLFARYLDPGRASREAGWHPYELNLESPRTRTEQSNKKEIEFALLLLPGPLNNPVRDAAVWGRLRVRTGERPAGIALERPDRAPPYRYHDTKAYPRVWWVQGLGPAPVDLDYMDAVKKVANSNPESFRVVSIIPSYFEVSMAAGETAVANPRLELKEPAPGRIEIESRRGKSGFIQISSQYFPGWRAFIDGGQGKSELRILPANGPFMVVPAPEGEWKFELIYQPWAFRIGLWASLTSLVMSVLMAILRRAPSRCCAQAVVVKAASARARAGR